MKLHTPPSVGLTDAQANPSLRLAHMQFCRKYCAPAEIVNIQSYLFLEKPKTINHHVNPYKMFGMYPFIFMHKVFPALSVFHHSDLILHIFVFCDILPWGFQCVSKNQDNV